MALFLYVFIVKYRNNLRIFVKQYIPDANFVFVFSVPCRLNRFFKVKDFTLIDILSNVIYKF